MCVEVACFVIDSLLLCVNPVMIGLKSDRPKPKTSDHQPHPTMRHVEITDALLTLGCGCQHSKKEEEEDDRIQQVRLITRAAIKTSC